MLTPTEKVYMGEMVQERVASDNVKRRDLFSALLEASNESGKEALTDDELVGALLQLLVQG